MTTNGKLRLHESLTKTTMPLQHRLSHGTIGNYSRAYVRWRDNVGPGGRVHQHWLSLLVLASCLFMLGTVSIVISSADSFSIPTAVPINALLGWVLSFAGVAQIVHALVFRKWREFFLLLALGILWSAFGISFLLYPVSGLDSAANFLVGFLACSSSLKLILSARLYPHRSWERIAINGIASWIVALLLLLFNANSSAWMLGLIVGFDLLFYVAWLWRLYDVSSSSPHSQNYKIPKCGNRNLQCENNVIYYNFKKD